MIELKTRALLTPHESYVVLDNELMAYVARWLGEGEGWRYYGTLAHVAARGLDGLALAPRMTIHHYDDDPHRILCRLADIGRMANNVIRPEFAHSVIMARVIRGEMSCRQAARLDGSRFSKSSLVRYLQLRGVRMSEVDDMDPEEREVIARSIESGGYA